MRVHVDLLGQFRIASDDRDVAAGAWRRERSAALVKLLALSVGHRLHREQAMDALWPETSPDAAAAKLRKAIHFARRALGDHALISLKNEIVALAPDRDLVVDVEAFEAAARAALRAGDPVACARAAARWHPAHRVAHRAERRAGR